MLMLAVGRFSRVQGVDRSNVFVCPKYIARCETWQEFYHKALMMTLHFSTGYVKIVSKAPKLQSCGCVDECLAEAGLLTVMHDS